MNPLYRITQLTEENRQLLRSVDELRAQVETARQELACDSATIAKLAKDKQELVSALAKMLEFSDRRAINKRTQAEASFADSVSDLLSRHA